MLDVAIYEKDGKRHLHDHVAQITHISGNLVLDFITDFNDHTSKSIPADNIERIMVKVYE